MKIRAQELERDALDYAVALCEGAAPDIALTDDDRYSTDWSLGGPILEREGVELICNLTPAEAERFKTPAHWRAWPKGQAGRSESMYGPTALIAAMRCHVRQTLGAMVEVPGRYLT